MTRAHRIGLVVSILLAASVAGALPVPAEPDAPLALGPSLLDDGVVKVPGWRLQVGDDPAWADPAWDDTAWLRVAPHLARHGQPLPEGWRGLGWLRLHFDVDPALVGQPLALSLEQFGALELYLDGRRIDRIGIVSEDPAVAVARFQAAPTPLSFDRAGAHVLALRMAHHQVPRLLWSLGRWSVRAEVSSAATAGADAVATARTRNRMLGWFCGIFLAFWLLHSLLFVFYPSIRANLDFSLLCLVLAGLVFLIAYRWEQPDPRFVFVSEPAMNLLGILLGIVSLRFAYRVFYPRPPLLFRAFLLAGLGLAAWTAFEPVDAMRFVFFLMLASSAELVRVIAVAVWRKKPGAWVIGAGALCLSIGFGIGLLANLGVLPHNDVTGALVPFSSMGALLVCMSVYLSRQFAAVHRDLQARLIEVERLSAETLEQERRLRDEAVQRSVLETRYEEKVRELEEARDLQLSMLPRTLPNLPDLDIAASMETATEVGGDYYDFEVDGEGSLILAIGDATGHGMRAGTMVTAAKSLFNVLASEHAPAETLSRSTAAIKRMNLRKLAMALTLARYRDGVLLLSAAGMPPAMVWRAASGMVEQVLLGGMPLGAMARFPYRETEIHLGPGDVVLLMSDGYPERCNAQAEMLGYERASATFAAAAAGTPSEILDALRADCELWADGHPKDDDITFVALKMRAAISPAPTRA